MSTVGIEYCVPCGLLDRAVDVQRPVLGRYGQQVDGVELAGGDGGVFETETDHYDVDAIVAAVGERTVATA